MVLIINLNKECAQRGTQRGLREYLAYWEKFSNGIKKHHVE